MKMCEYRHPNFNLRVQFIYHDEESYNETSKIIKLLNGSIERKLSELIEQMSKILNKEGNCGCTKKS